MKYTTEIVIDLPREKVIGIMDNTDNLKHWQKGLISANAISGEPGKEGSKMELHYKMGKRELVLIETILTRDFPEAFHATYDTKGVHNFQKNYFKEEGDNQTRWISETKFEFSGFFMKLMAFLMPGAFKKQSLQYMRDFKAFAEEGKSVKDSK
ncbi:MAG: SRPBCC family protein [Flavobacteriaceae bacterium]|nr:SRPBCC family protein [Flavobacteriaceae bacterium]